MRNLLTQRREVLDVASRAVPDLPLATTEYDVVTNTVLAVFGPTDDFHSVEVQRLPLGAPLGTPLGNSATQPQSEPQIVASFPLARPIQPNLPVDKIVSAKHFADSDTLSVILEGGDILLVNLGSSAEEPEVEIAGSIEAGIECAAWSPDEELLGLVTYSGNFVLLSRNFELVCDAELRSEDLDLSHHVDVGWGKKETQFRGTGAKADAAAALRAAVSGAAKGSSATTTATPLDPTLPDKLDTGVLGSLDDGAAHISWRGDGEVVAISYIDTHRGVSRRSLRIFSRHGRLETASEPCDGMEGIVAYRPSGNLVAAVRRTPGTSGTPGTVDIIFFERNGLRRGEFSLRVPSDEPVVDVAWNTQSDVLAVVFPSRIQLWTTKNYHWYLKQEFRGAVSVDSANSANAAFGDFVSARWHPENPYILLLQHSERLETLCFTWHLAGGSAAPPTDCGAAMVIDGATLNLTPLKIANTPPPLAFRSFTASEAIRAAATDATHSQIAILTADQLIFAEWDVTKPVAAIEAPKAVGAPLPVASFLPDREFVPLQVCFVGPQFVALLADIGGRNVVAVVDVATRECVHVVEPAESVVWLSATSDFLHAAFQTVSGAVWLISVAESSGAVNVSQIGDLPEPCAHLEVLPLKGVESAENVAENEALNGLSGLSIGNSAIPTFPSTNIVEKWLLLGLTAGGRLYANERRIATAATSFTATDAHLLFTTAQHTLLFVPLGPAEELAVPDATEPGERVRRIERGSLLVAAVPSRAAVVLQAPRGNLETIFPRAMVLARVRRLIDAGDYRAAFLDCRVHRVDLDLLHDHKPDAFYAKLEDFIDQLDSTEYLDLFLSCLRLEDVAAKYSGVAVPIVAQGRRRKEGSFAESQEDNKINRICQAVLRHLLTPQRRQKYLHSALTAYVCQQPPALESALTLVSELPDDATEAAVQHLCFLYDAMKLYDVALGLYDVPLALLVAQQSQKDPKEYLPFLQDLVAQPELRRKFLIDFHLGRHGKALAHLAEISGAEEEFYAYTVAHNLYKEALQLRATDEPKQKAVFALYAEHLVAEKQFRSAGLIWEMLGRDNEALSSFTAGLLWQEALAVAQRVGQVTETAEALATALAENRRFAEAATVRREYLADVAESVRLLCRGFQFAEALRVANTAKLVSEVDSGLSDGFGVIAELLADCASQYEAQTRRLRELRERKATDPAAFFGATDDNDNPDNVSVAGSELSTAASFLTRYTGKTGGTAQTGASRRTAKNKRREERKRARGKKGTVYEEEYLVNSVARMIDRLHETIPDAERLVEALVRRSRRAEAYEIQRRFAALLAELQRSVAQVFTVAEADRERVNEYGEVYYVSAVAVPEVKEFPVKEFLQY